jgi:tRNA (cmo5U34)-methyltransferase
MSVATHLGIQLRDYDRRIRTFIPHYDEMLDTAAALVPSHSASILDLGIGTGVLAARCLRVARKARVTGIDSDRGMLALARRRLRARVTLLHGRFEEVAFPRADAVVASLALHHIFTQPGKTAIYRRIYRSLRPGGILVIADCCPAAERLLRQAQQDDWLRHLRRTYSRTQATKYLRTWRHEDRYMPLETELHMLRSCGFHPEVVWRRGMFAVIAARIRRPA